MRILYLSIFACIALIAVIVFLIAPRKRRSTSPFDRTLYAHRGLHNSSRPENSLSAFQAAKESGFGVEFDVRFTADKQVVVFHDDTLTRMCGDNRRVDECTYEELQQLHLSDTTERIPLLSDVLSVLGDTIVLCEIKPSRSYVDTTLCEETYAILEKHKAKYCIESFNPFCVRWFKKHAPHVIRGILSKKYVRGEVKPDILRPFLTTLMANCLCRPDFIAYQHTDHKQPFFLVCRWFRPTTFAWTIRNHEEYATAKQTFDSVIFESFSPESE